MIGRYMSVDRGGKPERSASRGSKNGMCRGAGRFDGEFMVLSFL